MADGKAIGEAVDLMENAPTVSLTRRFTNQVAEVIN
jgi:hypothetical protein